MNNDYLGIADQSKSREILIISNNRENFFVHENIYLSFIRQRIDKIFSKKNICYSENEQKKCFQEMEFSEIRSTLKSCLLNQENYKSVIDLLSKGIADEKILQIWSPQWSTPYKFVYEKNLELG